MKKILLNRALEAKKKLFFLTALLCASVVMFAASNLCGVAPQYPAGGSGTVVFSWSTDDNGDVVVTIAPTGETTSATFRGTGFEGKLNGFTILSGEGFETSEPASKYFEMKSSVAGETTCKLYRTGEYDLPSPCQLKFTAEAGQALAWVANSVDMYDMTTPWIYNYGTLCGSELTTPSITSISDGVITFDAVVGATSYKAYIYRGSSYFTSIDVTSGSLMTYLPYLAGTYQVRLRAFSDTQYSDFSEPFSWEIVSNNISGNLPPSSVNKQSVSDGAETEVYVSLETDLVTGNILGIISPVNVADDDYVYWREDGIRISGFTYNGEPFANYFDAEFTQSHQIPSPDAAKIDTIHFYPKTTGEHIPAYGGVISYSDGILVWHYNNAGIYKNGVSFPDYIYGAGCGTLTRPIISSVSSSGVISFDAVPGATSYKAYVYNSALGKVYEQVVTTGETINYIPYLADTYKVCLKAFGDDDAYSAYSASVDWVLPTNPAGDLPQSNVNKIIMTNGDNATAVYFSAETDLMTGNVEFIISAIDPANEEYTYWREDGVITANLTYNEGTFSEFFDRVSSTNVPEGTKKIIFAPKTTGEHIPAYGGVIAFHGKTVWNYGEGKNTYNNGGFIFDYVYGTGCGTLTRPIISSVSLSGVISFDAVPGATSYKVYVYNSALEKVYEQVVTTGETINYIPYLADTYKVCLKAFGDDDAYSAYSASVDWVLPTNPAGDLPKSKVNKIIMTNGDNATAVYFSVETDLMTGNVEFIISAIDPANEEYTYWREDGVRTANLTYNGATFSDYFDRVSPNNVPEGTKKIIFAPKTTGENIPAYGGEIAFHGTTVWNYGDGKNTYNNGGFIFDYVYGTGCGTLTRPIISSVTSSGVISFAEVAGATSYIVYVYNSDMEKIYEQVVTPGATITYYSSSAGTCKVYLKAFGEDDAYSAISAPVDWTVPSEPTAISNTEAEVKAVKMIENGQLIIIKNGVKYNVAGQQVK